MSFNLRNRSLLTVQEYTPREFRYLLGSRPIVRTDRRLSASRIHPRISLVNGRDHWILSCGSRRPKGEYRMRSANYFVAAAFVVGLAGTASAQGTTAATTQPTTYGATVSHWLASGFVGGGFNASTSNNDPRIEENAGGVSFGGQVGYLWHGIVGPEFLAEWAPSFDVNAVFVDGNTHLFSYMINALAAAPLGADGQIMPFISGGVGRISMAADIINPVNRTTENNSNGGWGSNIGGGIMAFATEKVGVRGDLRYYHANSDTNFSGSAGDQLVESLVSGVRFWRATGGLSFRW